MIKESTMKQLVSNLAGKITRQQWKTEQLEDPEIGPVLRLVQEKRHLQYQTKKNDDPGMKIILHFRDVLK